MRLRTRPGPAAPAARATRVRVARHLVAALLSASLALVALGACGSAAHAGSTATAGATTSAPGASTPATTTGSHPTPIIYRPSYLNPSTPAPLVIVLHGAEGTPAAMVALTHFNRVANEHGFVVAYLGSSGPIATPWKSISDTYYIGSMIDAFDAGKVPGAGAIDPKRVYVTGFSAGGYESYRVGCVLSSKVAAVAPVAVTMNSGLYDTCQLARPVSIMITAGSGDGSRFAGAPGKLPSVYQTAARWRQLDGCPTHGTASQASIGRTSGQLWGGCANGSAVALVAVIGGTHLWPGMGGLAPGNPDATYDASEYIWSFFASHTAAPLNKADVTPLKSGLTIALAGAQIVCRFRLGEPVTVQLNLTRNGRTVRTKHSRESGSQYRLVMSPRGLKAGKYVLDAVFKDSYGRTLSTKIHVTLPKLA